MEDLGRSALADRFKASHAKQGGPFYLEVFHRLPPEKHKELLRRCERLIGQRHAGLPAHLGHGVVGGVPFVVAPWIEGIELFDLSRSLAESRVTLTLDTCVRIIDDLARAIHALHTIRGADGGSLVHGDVSQRHVRVGDNGQVWLTGGATPRGASSAAPTARLDVSGVAAILYDLVPLLPGTAERPALPTVLDRVIRRALGIGPPSDHLDTAGFIDRIDEVKTTLQLHPERAVLAELVKRTRARLAEGKRPTTASVPLEALPELTPIGPVRASPSTPQKAVQAPGAAAIPTAGGPRPTTSLMFGGEAAPPSTKTDSSPQAAAKAARPAALPETTPGRSPAPVALWPLQPSSQPSSQPSLQDEEQEDSDFLEPTLPGTSLPPAPTRRDPPMAPRSFVVESDEAPPTTGSRKATTNGDRRNGVRQAPAVRALLERGLVTMAQVEAAAQEFIEHGGRPLDLLVQVAALPDREVAAVLGSASGRPRLSGRNLSTVDLSAFRRLPQSFLLARRVLPMALEGDTLILAVVDPFDVVVIDEVRNLVGAKTVDVRVAPRATITQATQRAFSLASAFVPGLGRDAVRLLLCIDDDVKAQKIGARLVEEFVQVEHVVDGKTAREIITARPPAAVVTAVKLPDISARELLLFVRDHERNGELPFFVIGPNDEELATRILDLGADDYFSEPLRLDQLVAKLRRAIGKAARMSAEGGPESSTPGRPVPPPSAPSLSSRVGPGPPPFALADLPDLPPEFDAGPSPHVPAMPTGVMGTLRQMPLPEIVQNLEMGRKTARVEVVPVEGDKGMLAFDKGTIRYGECGALRGEQAFYALMRHTEGFFRIHYGDTPPTVNIDSPTTFLLLEAMRLMDEEGNSGMG